MAIMILVGRQEWRAAPLLHELVGRKEAPRMLQRSATIGINVDGSRPICAHVRLGRGRHARRTAAAQHSALANSDGTSTICHLWPAN
eukprot:6120678-Pyramimonas_sp.AAC.1